MNAELLQLVREAAAAAGVAEPAVLSPDAPTLALDAASDDFYIVGVIGGKEVGKSALINAIAGSPVSNVTDHGPGTDGTIAYVHASRADAVRSLLEHEAAGRHQVVTHQLAHLERQVLLDLPDLDSHYTSHVQLVRSMLRHMLYPVWVTSVEKYADRAPRDMLRRVADGNAADNFVYVLNKADQGGGDVESVREDYARRVAALLSLAVPPRIWLTSAGQPDAFDLPALRQLLARDRPTKQIVTDRTRAARRQDIALVDWLGEQPLRQRADRLDHLHRDAEELLTARVGGPILATLLPALAADNAYRQAVADDTMDRCIARWPIVRLVHTLLAPLLAMAAAVLRGPGGGGNAAAAVDRHLCRIGTPANGEPSTAGLALLVRSAFAHIRHASPVFADLYPRERPWEDAGAREAATLLRGTLALAMEGARDRVVADVAGRDDPLRAAARTLLTVGAAIWFPFAQPLAELILPPLVAGQSLADLGGQAIVFVIQILGAAYLLRAAGFLIIWFVMLWLALRWQTERRVRRVLAATLLGPAATDDDANLPRQALAWLDDLLAPIQSSRQEAAALADRVEDARQRLTAA